MNHFSYRLKVKDGSHYSHAKLDDHDVIKYDTIDTQLTYVDGSGKQVKTSSLLQSHTVQEAKEQHKGRIAQDRRSFAKTIMGARKRLHQKGSSMLEREQKWPFTSSSSKPKAPSRASKPKAETESGQLHRQIAKGARAARGANVAARNTVRRRYW